MEISLLLMQQIAQLFIVLLMGYVVVKAGLLKSSDSRVLSVVFVYLVMPCVVLNAFQIDDTPQIRAGLLYSMGIAVGMHIVFLILNAIFKKPLKLDVVEQVNIIYSNAAALVIPLVQALLGEEYVVYSCAFVIVQLILLWTHASACLQEGAKLEWKKILTNVNLIAIVAGALLYLLHISLPTPIVSTLSSVGAMIGPMGMLLAGMAIADAAKESLLYTAQLSSRCTSSVGRTDGGIASSQCHPRIYLDCGRQGDSHDGVSVRHHPSLRDSYIHGAAVQPGCSAFECPVCTQYIALHRYNAHHDRSV